MQFDDPPTTIPSGIPTPMTETTPTPKINVGFSSLNAKVESVTFSKNKNFRASIFAGAIGANVANLQEAKLFEQELNRKSSNQACVDNFGHFNEQPIDEHNFCNTYNVSRGELLVAEKWRCVRKIAFGSTSVVYLSFSIDYKQGAAVKVCSFSKGDDALRTEASVYDYIQGGPGIPRVYWYGQENQRHFLVMELLGPNLFDLIHYCGGKFSLKTVCMIAVQIFESFDWLHRSGCIHRDIRPQNFCIANGLTSRQVFLIDFATAIKHRPKVTVQGQQYIPRMVGTSLKGHAIYDSVSAHYGNEHGYRDDLESALYMLVYFLIGDLPWRGLKYNQKPNEKSAQTEHKTLLDQVCEKKLTSSFLEVIPPEFQEIYNYIRSLSYEQIPDYEFIIHLFLTMLRDAAETFDYQYDWLLARKATPHEMQLERKKIISRIVPSEVKPFLSLQTHRFQFTDDNFDNFGSAKTKKEKNNKESLTGSVDDAEAIFAAFSERDRKD